MSRLSIHTGATLRVKLPLVSGAFTSTGSPRAEGVLPQAPGSMWELWTKGHTGCLTHPHGLLAKTFATRNQGTWPLFLEVAVGHSSTPSGWWLAVLPQQAAPPTHNEVQGQIQTLGRLHLPTPARAALLAPGLGESERQCGMTGGDLLRCGEWQHRTPLARQTQAFVNIAFY